MTSVPTYNFTNANEELLRVESKIYYECCGKGIYVECMQSVNKSGNSGHCPFGKVEYNSKSEEETIKELMTQVAANNSGAINLLGTYYSYGQIGLHQNIEK